MNPLLNEMGYRAGPSAVATGVCVVLGIAAGVVLYFTFLSKQNQGRFHGFLGWLYDLLQFKVLIVEALIRVLFLASACAIVLCSLAMLFQGYPGMFLGLLVIGSLLNRIAFEFMMFVLVIVRNTTDINEKLGARKEAPARTE